jgi:hypothetical protein
MFNLEVNMFQKIKDDCDKIEKKLIVYWNKSGLNLKLVRISMLGINLIWRIVHLKQINNLINIYVDWIA